MAVVKRILHDCPICGGDVVMIDYVSTEGDDFLMAGVSTYSVVCPKCMIGSAPDSLSPEDALNSWEATKTMYASEKELRKNRG